jgi:hypothetical protein
MVLLPPDKCPCCKIHQESIYHLLTCQDDAVLNHRNEAKSKLIYQLSKIHTLTYLTLLIRYGLEQWEEHLKDRVEEMRATGVMPMAQAELI